MREIFKYYLKECRQACIDKKVLFFEFNKYSISFELNIKEKKNKAKKDGGDEGDEDFKGIQQIEDLDFLLNKDFEVGSFILRGDEYLGWREDLEKVYSITDEMYLLLDELKESHTDSVINFYTEVDFGEGSEYCNTEPNYVSKIFLKTSLLTDFAFNKFLINLIETVNSDSPNFYLPYFRNRISLSDNKNINIISTGTKVRRLAYIKQLASFFTSNPKVSKVAIASKFEKFVSGYTEELQKQKNNKGVINITKSGISAKPYINFAELTKLINKTNSIFSIGKQFKVYQTILNLNLKKENIFELSAFDKLYFFELILKYDYFYFSNLLELLRQNKKNTYESILNNFQNKLIQNLEEFKIINRSSELKIIRNIDSVLTRIKKWEKPLKYLEHILMPRLNWMLDLDILDFTDNCYSLNDSGKRLFSHFCIWQDLNAEKIVNCESFLDYFSVQVFDDCFNNGKSINENELSKKKSVLFKEIEESFSLFKTLAPNRVTISQSVNFSKYELYLKENIAIDFQNIINILSSPEQTDYIFKYQYQYKDGYLQKLK
jgi:hypothetical protein